MHSVHANARASSTMSGNVLDLVLHDPPKALIKASRQLVLVAEDPRTRRRTAAGLGPPSDGSSDPSSEEIRQRKNANCDRAEIEVALEHLYLQGFHAC
jgi:hypothetical protein